MELLWQIFLEYSGDKSIIYFSKLSLPIFKYAKNASTMYLRTQFCTKVAGFCCLAHSMLIAFSKSDTSLYKRQSIQPVHIDGQNITVKLKRQDFSLGLRTYHISCTSE
ncbi:hypothetical protein RF11_12336 [Thelohanellus kitauei]|uniref:Uncharacterized protein n=1 Tax=Thelohanellus kitauei TaxID=669202 RepID=A0A0C2JVC5_THEKT|nr:hypothetical protein RF11_12336 [Thelohanellus kitauei]